MEGGEGASLTGVAIGYLLAASRMGRSTNVGIADLQMRCCCGRGRPLPSLRPFQHRE